MILPKFLNRFQIWFNMVATIFEQGLMNSPQTEEFILLIKVMATHSSTLAWKIPWMEDPGRLQSMGSLRVGTTERLHYHFSLSCIGEGNSNPLQCSCLENPRDGGAWWAAVYGVAQSRTRLKWLSSSISIYKVDSRRFYEVRKMAFQIIWKVVREEAS